MVVRMSWRVLETCRTYVPRQRHRCSRTKVDHHQPARFLVELAVGVHLVTHPILQRDHVLRSGIASALGRVRLERTAAPDLSGRSLRRPQMAPPGI